LAGTIKTYVEKLVSAQIRNVSPDDDAAWWVSTLSDDFYAKLARTGLVPERKKVGTLVEMMPDIIKEKSIGNTPATAEIYGQSARSLYKHFGKDRRVDTITETDAKDFKVWLKQNGKLKNTGGLAPKTVAKRLQHVFSFFNKMKKKGIISSNPFDGLVDKVPVDERRNLYIKEETILKVMEYAPDAEWRLIIALWRFAGLRAASEVLMLKWSDILWDQERIVVHSPKTEHCGKGIRIIPFFPHIEECLIAAFEQAPEGAVYVVEKHAPLYLRGQKERVYISRQGNIGTMFRKIILRAGIVPWEKLIQNLRASFENDLMSGKYGQYSIYVIAKWLGHSVQVMLKHYGRFQQSDYDQVAEACERVKREKEQKNGVKAATMGIKSVNLDTSVTQNQGSIAENIGSNPIPRLSQNPTQYTAVGAGME